MIWEIFEMKPFKAIMLRAAAGFKKGDLVTFEPYAHWFNKVGTIVAEEVVDNSRAVGRDVPIHFVKQVKDS